MPITVELQDMHSYNPIAFIVIFCFIIASLVFLLLFKLIIKNRNEVNKKPRVYVTKPMLQRKYLAMVNDIENQYNKKAITNRVAYQELSRIVRSFVYEITGVQAHNYTLTDIEKINMPQLYNMIDECYMPEFALDDSGNIYESAMKARKVIEEWN